MANWEVQDSVVLEYFSDIDGWILDIYNYNLTKNDLQEIAAYLVGRADELPEA